MTYAGAEFWDRFFRQRRESGDDLDWAGLWTRPFLVPLRQAGVCTILELGCGTGNDAVMSNVAMHMFPDDVTRAVFAQVGRLVRTGGLFAFHVNSLADRPLRARRLPVPSTQQGSHSSMSGAA
ncbi:MAG: class I SAM-dependent methyltransferase [Streptosporangiaceae bacterium]